MFLKGVIHDSHGKAASVPIFVLFAILFAVLISGIVHSDFDSFSEIDTEGMEMDAQNIRFCIDSIDPDGGYLYVRGWAVDQEPLQYVNCRIALQCQSDGRVYQMKTVVQMRDDLPEALELEGAQWGGIQACVKRQKLDQDEQYRIFLIYRSNGNNALQDTGILVDAQGGRING